MQIVAYLYSDSLLEPLPDPQLWGWDIDRVYQDLGQTSGKSSKVGGNAPQASDRSQLQQLLADSEVHPPDYVLVRSLAEFGESVAAVSRCLDHLESLGTVVVALDQDYSSDRSATSAPQQQWHTDLLRLADEIQAEQRRRHLRQGHARNRIKALPPPGKAPYGYRRGKEQYVLDRTTAPVIKEFFEQFLLYGSLRRAVRHLEKKYAKKISVSTGRRWLTNPVYRGDLAYGDGGVVQDTHTPIISRAEAAQIDRILRRNSQLPPRTASAPRSLAGLITCRECQSAMKTSLVSAPRRTKTYLYLRPVACGRSPRCKAIAYDAVLSATIATICRELPPAVAAMMRAMNLTEPGLNPTSPLTDQIQQAEAVLGQLPGLVETGVLDQDTADLRAYKLRSEVAALRQQLAQLPPVNLQELAQSVSIPQFWQDLSEPERRFFFREFIRGIYITRGEGDWQVELEFIFF